MYMSDSRRKINVENKSPQGRRLWLNNGEHRDIAAGETEQIEFSRETLISNITDYNKLIDENGKGPEGHLVYDDAIFTVEEHNQKPEEPKKAPEKKVKRVEK